LGKEMSEYRSILFQKAEDWHFNACISKGHANHEVFAEGYRRAAERLFMSLQDDRFDLDLIIYPTVFLYRHWLELRLKRIIDEGRQLLQEGRGFPERHEIHLLWPVAKDILRSIWPNDPPEYRLIDSVAKDFEVFDRRSESFRYPLNRHGVNDLEEISHINIRLFVETMASVANFLDGASSAISDYLSDLRSSY
jgi:hypothetical protein